MYLPKHFLVEDREILFKVMGEYPLATLIANAAGELEINHIPLMASKDGQYLHGHIARMNPLAKLAQMGDVQLTAIFHGPEAYITPAWYPSKYETGKVVPTWNYAVVHAQGTLSLKEDPQWIRQHVSQLTDTHEPTYQSDWKLDDAPEDYVQMMLKAIVGIEIKISSLVGKFKLSQNRTPAEYDGVIQNLKQSSLEDLQAMLKLMQEK